MDGIQEYPRSGRGNARRFIPVIIAAAGAVVISVLLVLFLTGVIRFGKPRLYGIVTSARIDSRDRPLAPRSTFQQSDTRIYCCAKVKAYEDTVLESRWYAGERQVGGYSCAFGAISGSASGKFLPTNGTVAFYLDRPSSGWSAGRYTVRLYADGKRAAEISFIVTSRESTGPAYRDPSGLFTVSVPDGWVKSEDTSGSVLAEFSAPSGSYPPRFAVVSTDLPSVDPGYLNQQLGSDSGAGKFEQYALGGSAGARRDYLWDTQISDKDVELHSIQVLVTAGNGKVYGLNCHVLKGEYDRYLPTFNAVINSFRLQ